MDPKTKKMLMIGCGIFVAVVVFLIVIYLNKASAKDNVISAKQSASKAKMHSNIVKAIANSPMNKDTKSTAKTHASAATKAASVATKSSILVANDPTSTPTDINNANAAAKSASQDATTSQQINNAIGTNAISAPPSASAPAASTPVNNNVPSGQLPQVGKKFVLKCVNGNGYIIGVVPVGYTPNKQNATIYTIDDKQNLSPTWGGLSQYPISLVQNSSKTNTLILLTGTVYAIALAPNPVGNEIASVDNALSPTYVSSYAVTAEYL